MKYMLLLGIDPAIERDKLVSEFTNAKRVALSGREFCHCIPTTKIAPKRGVGIFLYLHVAAAVQESSIICKMLQSLHMHL